MKDKYEIKLPPHGMRHSIRDYLSAKGTFSRKSHRGERRVFVLFEDAVKAALEYTGQEIAFERSKSGEMPEVKH